MTRALAAGSALFLLLLLSACTGGRTAFAYSIGTGGDPVRGKDLIARYDCGSCHSIPGIRGAQGLVGPPLILFGRRTFIAGQVPNTPDYLVRWLLDPKAIEPGTAMPKLGLSEQDARHIAAYLYTLRSRSWNGGSE